MSTGPTRVSKSLTDVAIVLGIGTSVLVMVHPTGTLQHNEASVADTFIQPKSCIMLSDIDLCLLISCVMSCALVLCIQNLICLCEISSSSELNPPLTMLIKSILI